MMCAKSDVCVLCASEAAFFDIIIIDSIRARQHFITGPWEQDKRKAHMGYALC